MKELKLDLKHCYGIKKLEHVFDFRDGNVFAIYAANGMMKTSLAKTFQDASQGKKSKDRIWPANPTKMSICDETDTEISKENIFVIEPYNESYSSNRISTLLVNPELQKKYEDIYKEINEKSDVLIGKLKGMTGPKVNISKEISNVFISKDDSFFQALDRIEKDVKNGSEGPLKEVIYSHIFNPKVEALLEQEDFRNKVAEYMKNYNKLISTSNFFKKGVFTHNNASDIAKNLEKNGFFQADHSVYLMINGEKTEITSLNELERAIQSEIDRIIDDDSLRKSFEKINKDLDKNPEHRAFRDCLEKHLAVILSEISNPAHLKQQLWIQYLISVKDAYIDFLKSFHNGKDEIDKIVDQAKRESTKWNEVISIFNKRFTVPFLARMDNREDVILKRDVPNIEFDFLEDMQNDKSARVPVEEEQLRDVLSNGEKRALYILNIIYEVEARKKDQQTTIFIVDDLADSFDYKNKYAIVEYLAEIKSHDKFYQLILSHNFDFYRTVSSRLGLKRKHRLLTNKNSEEIIIKEEHYQNPPFNNWRNRLGQNNEETVSVASIPLLRNLAEFSGDEESYKKLTSLLHIKDDTSQFLISDLECMIKIILHGKENLSLPNPDTPVIKLIFQVGEDIFKDSEENSSNLEHKVAISIAIRLKAEEFMKRKINNEEFFKSIDDNQTRRLMERYKEDFGEGGESIEVLDRVQLMTPENIHLNSFMYEPILDLSIHHLKNLFKDINDLS